MKFEIRDPSAINESDQPYPTAIREELPTRVVAFIPLAEGLDGTPHCLEDDTVFMGMVGGYQEVFRSKEVWTVEFSMLEELLGAFRGFDLTITDSKVVSCAALLEFEEPPSVASSFS